MMAHNAKSLRLLMKSSLWRGSFNLFSTSCRVQQNEISRKQNLANNQIEGSHDKQVEDKFSSKRASVKIPMEKKRNIELKERPKGAWLSDEIIRRREIKRVDPDQELSIFSGFDLHGGITAQNLRDRQWQGKVELRPHKWMEWFREEYYQAELYDQQFIPERIVKLGPDLAAAHFVVLRGGKVRFLGETEWVEQDEDNNYELPEEYVPDLFIEAIDLSKARIHYEGYKNINYLQYLRELILDGNEVLDDWCMDRISAQYYMTLEHIDISNTAVTQRGVAALTKMDELRSIRMDGLKEANHQELICHMLEDSLPTLECIEGVDYLNPMLLTRGSSSEEDGKKLLLQDDDSTSNSETTFLQSDNQDGSAEKRL